MRAGLAIVLLLLFISGAQGFFSINLYSLTARQHLPANVISPLPMPLYNDPVTCGGLWAKAGYVCIKDQLIDFSNKDKGQVINSHHLYQEALDQNRATVRKIIEFNLMTHLSPADQKEATYFDNDLHIGVMKRSSSTCMDYVTHRRSSALCYICSAQAHTYFFHNKGLISQRECNSYLAGCDYHFENLHRLLRFQAVAVQLVTGLLAKKQHPMHMIISVSIQHTSMVTQALSDLIIKWNSAKKADAKTREKVATEICEKTFTISNPPFFQGMIPLMMHTSAMLSSFINFARQLKVSQSSARTLNGLANHSSSPLIFNSDIAVLSTSSHDAAVVANAFNPHFKAMNLSLAFP